MSERFLFDQEFDRAGRTVARGTVESFSEDDLEAARAQAYAEGQQAAEQAAQASIDASISAVLSDIASQLRDTQASTLSMIETQRREAVEVAVAIGERLAEQLLSAHPRAELEAMITECVTRMADEPRLVIRASEPVVEQLRDRMDAIAQATGFEGHLVLIHEDSMGDQDCRVEWADGGASRDHAATEAEVDAAVASYLASTEG